ncbi:biphenyl-2,3-diol 1,2-dioxygenase [Azospirillum rugosum]|uniref:2,3-dihydroxybiphenyl 1,2-dioxygenase n=1 Tax=Azospirillum rugosum TaxID=416170 RepID=A0ABS4SX70_9PROT|nr:biphenyl-2,3-diol 1,2-dioxygenase [Azospirillum rugosum]MBP2297146.1 2,3-dihydroxybiphenyl 1,2-dioxygenase [Azospirillum rugosum]MDQ0530948.1 2,3-dihydroxybiphenyl 1,2-dioxygenase [Azospirillum rugosum]
MSVQRLGYLGFEVTDVSAWCTFATDKLGMMECSASDDGARFRIDSRAWRLNIEKGSADDIVLSGYEVDSENALWAVKKRLEEHGVAVTVEGADIALDRGVLGLISCADPANNRVEIYYGATELFERPFHSPAGVSGFQTGDQGFGHYVLNVSDVGSALDFYIKALGFQVSDIIDWKLREDLTVQLYFLHCNTRHHTLAISKLPLEKRLHHFMLETKHLDDVGFAFDRFEAADAVVATLGRHSNDQMISFYGATPSGFAVEYGWGARHVAADWSVVRYDTISVWGHRFAAPK